MKSCQLVAYIVNGSSSIIERYAIMSDVSKTSVAAVTMIIACYMVTAVGSSDTGEFDKVDSC